MSADLFGISKSIRSIPTVHLNGTKGRVLVDQLQNASEALHKALAALAEASPHGRDYYPQGESAFQTAAGAHADRLRAVQKVKDDCDAIALAIYDQLQDPY
jgi:hypothetical protein